MFQDSLRKNLRLQETGLSLYSIRRFPKKPHGVRQPLPSCFCCSELPAKHQDRVRLSSSHHVVTFTSFLLFVRWEGSSSLTMLLPPPCQRRAYFRLSSCFDFSSERLLLAMHCHCLDCPGILELHPLKAAIKGLGAWLSPWSTSKKRQDLSKCVSQHPCGKLRCSSTPLQSQGWAGWDRRIREGS